MHVTNILFSIPVPERKRRGCLALKIFPCYKKADHPILETPHE